MKLSLDTYAIGTDFTLTDLLELLPANGFQGVEFRCEANQKHGVEPETSKEERRRVRAFLDAVGIEVACLSTSQRYESPDPAVRQAAIDRTKQFIDLAADRYTVEQCIQEGKGETGLDQYEVRHWHSWHRHVTLSMMAHAWLASVRHKAEQEKGGPSRSWPN